MRRDATRGQHLFLDLGREHVHAAQDHHVIRPPGDLLHPPHRPRGAGQKPRKVAGPVADHRQTLFGERREHQLAQFPVRQHFARLRVDDLGQEVILPDDRAVFRLDTFVGDTRPHDLGQPVDIDGVHVERLFHLAPHRIGPGFGPEDADFERRASRVQTKLMILLKDIEHIGGRDHDRLGREILNERHLPLGHPTRHRDRRGPQPFDPVMRAQTAGKEAIAIGIVHDVAGSHARGTQRPRDEIGPVGDVARGISHDGRFARRAGTGMHTYDLLARDREKPEGVVVAQVALVGEGELGEVRQRVKIVGMHPRLVEPLPIHRHVVIGMTQRPFQPPQLQRANFVDRGDLDRVQRRTIRGQVLHLLSSSNRCPGIARDMPRISAIRTPS